MLSMHQQSIQERSSRKRCASGQVHRGGISQDSGEQAAHMGTEEGQEAAGAPLRRALGDGGQTCWEQRELAETLKQKKNMAHVLFFYKALSSGDVEDMRAGRGQGLGTFLAGIAQDESRV